MTKHGAAALGLIIVVMSVAGSWGLRCFQCTVLPPPQYSNKTARLCAHFDGSELYQVDCPFSTFCMKRISELPLPKGRTVVSITRGCANQKYNYQVHDGHRWQMESVVEGSVYDPGCYPSGDQGGVKSSTSQYCYCSDNLCNGGQGSRGEPSGMGHTDTMAVIFVFNVMKYLRSLR